MKTIIAGIDKIEKAAQLIKDGQIVAFPTETVYGLGANALNPQAVKKIFEAKGRPQDNPLIVHISKWQEAEKFAYTNELSDRLFQAFSPGPITLVLKKKKIINDVITAGLDTVGIRIPAHYIARKLIELSNCPVAAPSANTSSRLSPTRAEDVYEDLQGKIPLIIDGGDCQVGIESTVIDLTGDIPTILRPGSVTAKMLLEVLDEVKNHTGEVKVASSPGMKYKHYASIVDCVLARSLKSALVEYDRAEKEGKKVVIMGREGYLKDGRNFISLGKTPEEVARNLYKSLRKAEKEFDLIIIEEFSFDDLEYSIMNRLLKSTQGVIV
ncbi:MAG: L-threonylcarbamoyladenylate synthase [Bacillota bacterium]|jgi:L-threonylcarbamoyladenylate synthase|nr:L-threonylcarbamoyladenylate synthase [Bacillota bacterium]HHU43319.1 threonylcarbamoyl-AMP synthase [Clostridiales bacterium]